MNTDNKTALIAMSGGVDSSVAALLMKQDGYKCMGITMKLFHNEEVGVCREHTCCSLDDIQDAKSVADRLEMPHYVLDFSEGFEKKIIGDFVECYEKGWTPNPCINCNRYMKFDKLFKRAQELGYEYVVTGHYARIEKNEKTGRFELKKGLDPIKDQSYVLYTLTQEQLAHTVFPLGGMPKAKARELAEEYGFINAHKHDSQDICFVVDGNYADFICGYTGKKYAAGNFVDWEGNVLGRHKGIIHYTIGQRKGLGLSLKRPMFVCDIRPETNEVVLTENEGLFSTTVRANHLNLISVDRIEGEMRIKAKIRYRQEEQWAIVTQPEEDVIQVVFDEPQRAVTKGQALVLYDNDVVVGGGTIY